MLLLIHFVRFHQSLQSQQFPPHEQLSQGLLQQVVDVHREQQGLQLKVPDDAEALKILQQLQEQGVSLRQFKMLELPHRLVLSHKEGLVVFHTIHV